jgi:hypothetical protein
MFEEGYPGEPPQDQPQPEAEEPAPPSIPWQCKERYPSAIAAMWETIKVVLVDPSRAFSNMRVENSLTQSLIYIVILGSIGGIIGQLYGGAFQSMGSIIGGGREGFAIGIGVFGLGFVVSVVVIPIVTVVGVFVGSAILHLCLMIVGGANKGFEATFSVVAYCGGSTAIFNVIPFCGAWVGGVWCIVLEIMGLAATHEISTGKAALAVLMPIIAAVCCCGAFFVLWAALMGFAATAG